MTTWQFIFGMSVRGTLLVTLFPALAADPPRPASQADASREAAIVEFTRKMQAANYPALFDQAAQEFHVPADILKGLAFAETRWEHLTWPPGETASPDTGMPRPYGIMSLWDNPFFGHSLLEAARLIGQNPEILKQEPLQNIRGAAALLHKLYDETSRPDAPSMGELEGWRFAIRKYCGIPEPDLNARHALEVYTFIDRGYHQYGIEWNGRPINLEPLRQETMQIVAEEEAKREARRTASAGASTAPIAPLVTHTQSEAALEAQKLPRRATTQASGENTPPSPTGLHPDTPSTRSTLLFIGGALVALAAMVILAKRAPKP